MSGTVKPKGGDDFELPENWGAVPDSKTKGSSEQAEILKEVKKTDRVRPGGQKRGSSELTAHTTRMPTTGKSAPTLPGEQALNSIREVGKGTIGRAFKAAKAMFQNEAFSAERTEGTQRTQTPAQTPAEALNTALVQEAAFRKKMVNNQTYWQALIRKQPDNALAREFSAQTEKAIASSEEMEVHLKDLQGKIADDPSQATELLENLFQSESFQEYSDVCAQLSVLGAAIDRHEVSIPETVGKTQRPATMNLTTTMSALDRYSTLARSLEGEGKSSRIERIVAEKNQAVAHAEQEFKSYKSQLDGVLAQPVLTRDVIASAENLRRGVYSLPPLPQNSAVGAIIRQYALESANTHQKQQVLQDWREAVTSPSYAQISTQNQLLSHAAEARRIINKKMETDPHNPILRPLMEADAVFMRTGKALSKQLEATAIMSEDAAAKAREKIYNGNLFREYAMACADVKLLSEAAKTIPGMEELVAHHKALADGLELHRKSLEQLETPSQALDKQQEWLAAGTEYLETLVKIKKGDEDDAISDLMYMTRGLPALPDSAVRSFVLAHLGDIRSKHENEAEKPGEATLLRLQGEALNNAYDYVKQNFASEVVPPQEKGPLGGGRPLPPT